MHLHRLQSLNICLICYGNLAIRTSIFMSCIEWLMDVAYFKCHVLVSLLQWPLYCWPGCCLPAESFWCSLLGVCKTSSQTVWKYCILWVLHGTCACLYVRTKRLSHSFISSPAALLLWSNWCVIKTVLWQMCRKFGPDDDDILLCWDNRW